MDRGAWQATVHGGHKESDTTELITLSLSKRHKNINIIHVPGEHQTVRDFFLGGGLQNHCRWTVAMKLKNTCSLEKSYYQPRQHIRKQRHYFAKKGPSSQSYGFSSSHVWMWKLDYKKSWTLKNWCFWTLVLKKTLESPLDCKEIQPVHPEGNHS